MDLFELVGFLKICVGLNPYGMTIMNTLEKKHHDTADKRHHGCVNYWDNCWGCNGLAAAVTFMVAKGLVVFLSGWPVMTP